MSNLLLSQIQSNVEIITESVSGIKPVTSKDVMSEHELASRLHLRKHHDSGEQYAVEIKLPVKYKRDPFITKHLVPIYADSDDMYGNVNLPWNIIGEDQFIEAYNKHIVNTFPWLLENSDKIRREVAQEMMDFLIPTYYPKTTIEDVEKHIYVELITAQGIGFLNTKYDDGHYYSGELYWNKNATVKRMIISANG